MALVGRRARLASPVERSVADYLLSIGPRAGAMSAREIATATGTSDATVIRTARSLGFTGFRELRRFVAGQTDEVTLGERLRVTLAAAPDPDAELRVSIERQRMALESMDQAIPESEFHAANRVIDQAPYVWWSGVGPSAHLAGYAAFLFRRLGKDSGVLTHAGFDAADELLGLRGWSRRCHPGVRPAPPACTGATGAGSRSALTRSAGDRLGVALGAVARRGSSGERPGRPGHVRLSCHHHGPGRSPGPGDGGGRAGPGQGLCRAAQRPPRGDRRPAAGSRPLVGGDLPASPLHRERGRTWRVPPSPGTKKQEWSGARRAGSFGFQPDHGRLGPPRWRPSADPHLAGPTSRQPTAGCPGCGPCPSGCGRPVIRGVRLSDCPERPSPGVRASRASGSILVPKHAYRM